jgi:pimeloyl-ACP methyl ester carboxylesterase
MPADDSSRPIDYRAATVERVDAGDATLPLRRFGSGPPLLLVHGFPLSGFTWRQLLPALAQRHTCLVPDLAGLGDSRWDAHTEFSWDGHARRLRRVIDHAGVSRYSILAQDTGGTIARRLALDDGARVERLVLINTEMPGHRPPWIPLYQWQMRWLPGAAAVFRRLLRADWFVKSSLAYGDCFADQALLEGEFRASFITAFAESPLLVAGMKEYLKGLYWDFVDALRQRHGELKMPVLLVWGEDDPIFPVALAREMAKQFADCRGLVAIPRAKLLVHEERPQQVAAAVLPFLAA